MKHIMNNNLDLSALFNKFVGKEVQSPVLSSPDPVIEEMKEVACDNGLVLRVWFPGMMGTMDHRLDRLNARIEKDADGKWRVGSKFNLG